ncbi:MAG: glycolate oxidase subunit GlcD, partial [Deltaproteobacteria bacterium]|nr:glycolate oxidase subunit GlcD [Deltaproteobacteria bacterium]
NIHFNIILDKRDKEILAKAESAVQDLFEQTVALGGTISGEHGVGVSKAPDIDREIGAAELSLMKGLKAACDPNGVLNPGKIF